MTRKRTRATASSSPSKRRLVDTDSFGAHGARERFEQAYADLRKQQGLPVIYYSARGEYVFHLFGLHQAVSMNGGFDEVCAKSLWGHLAGDICKVSKRRIAAAREAELCYKEHILPFEKKLRDLEYPDSAAAPSTPSASCSENPSSPLSGSQNCDPGYSLNGATIDTCLSTVQSPDLYSWSNVHVVSVKVAGFPFCPHLPVVVGPSALINPDGIRPDLIPPADRDGAVSQSDTSSLGNRTPSIKSRGSVPEVTAPSSSREADYGFLRLVSVPVSDVRTSRFPPKRQNQSPPATKVPDSGDASHGEPSLGSGSELALCPRRSGAFGGSPPWENPNSKKRSFDSTTRSLFQQTKAIDDPWEVSDPVPGDRAHSRVRWVRELAKDVGGASVNWSRHDVLHLRYGGELRRSRDKLCALARRKYKDAQERLDSASVSSYYDSDSESEEGEEPLDVREGAEYQAEIPAWRPKPKAPTADEARWLSVGRIWPTPQTENGVLNGMEACPVNLCIQVPRPHNFYSDVDARHQWVDQSSKHLEDSLGAAAQDLGVSNIGFRIARNWAPDEEGCFKQGLEAVGRDFEQLQAKFLPHKDPAQVVGYYYNIWKLGRTQAAREWYADIAAKKAQILREEEEQLRREEEECSRLEEKRREARYKANQRRAFKNILVWIKGVGQNPFNINVVQRAKTIQRGLDIREKRRMEGADKALKEYF